mgnify:FL=1
MAKRSEVRDLNSLLDVLERRINEPDDSPDITVREVLELIGRRAYGPLLLIVGLISISPLTVIPGATWAFATLTLLIALQLALHRKTPWMPRQALDMKLSERTLSGFIRGARPTAKFIDSFVRPRLEFLAQSPAVIIIALLIMLAALITYPFGLVPVLPLIPGIAIVLFGLGLTARDGVLLGLGTLIMCGATWLVYTRIF